MLKVGKKLMDIDKKIDLAQAKYNELLNCEKIYFENLVPSMLGENIAGVYVIFDKNTSKALYVGRTKKLRTRLYTNHLQGNKSTARLKKYIVEDEELSNIRTYNDAKKWIKENCYFQYIIITDSRERGHVEGLFGYLLNSKYIEDEH